MGWFKRLEFSKHFFGSVEKAIEDIESRCLKLKTPDKEEKPID
jgi:hypothetical protein